jgi:photosystem II stability/assembly factor-like uncharacterized protein
MKKYLLQFSAGMELLVVFACAVNSQWVQTNVPVDYYISALAVSDSNVFAGTSGGVFLSTNTGTSWIKVNGLKDTEVKSLAISGGYIFAGTHFGGGIYLSTDNGISWSGVDSGLPTLSNVSSFEVIDNNIFAGTNAGVFFSTNNGSTWSAVNMGLTYRVIQALAVSSTEDIFAGTLAGIFLSTNNGTNWIEVNTGLTNVLVNCLAVSDSNVFAGTYDGGIFLSTNNGTDWTEVNNGLTNTYINCIIARGNNIFAGTYNGVFLSTNNGTNWNAVNTDLPANTRVLSLAISGTEIIFAGTLAGGIWYRPLSEMVGVITHKPRSELYKLTDFKLANLSRSNHNIVISLSLLRSEMVTVKVYSLSGHEIEPLVNKHLWAGTQSIIWNTQYLATGCYTVKIQAGSNTYVKNILILQ